MNCETNKSENKLMTTKISSWKVFAMTLVAAFAFTAMPEVSMATASTGTSKSLGDGGIGGALCNIASWFKGDTGKAVATIAIIFLGIAAFFGKVTWGLALMFGVGIFAIFGASEIVEAISDADGGCS